ncbi:MAG: aldose epimerase family protein [Sphingomonas sp.]
MSSIETIEIAGPRGLRAAVLSYGGRLQRLDVPDRDGEIDSVVLGHADPESYRRDAVFLGALIGRYANRIAGARLSLDGRTYDLPANDGANHLHGGPEGFHHRPWEVVTREPHAVTLRLISPDGDQGYPGGLAVEARYAFVEPGALDIVFTARCDAPTVVNLTHHAYFNLAGQRRGGSIGDHLLMLAASRYTPVDAGSIPLGPLTDVAGSPFDFRTPHRIGDRWDSDHPQVAQAGGYDHNYVVDSPAGTLRRVATLYDPHSGRVLDLSSTAPGLQFYSGNALASDEPGLGGTPYRARQGLCLEPQLFPDSPNRPDYPSARIAPGEVYRHHIRFAFRTAMDAESAFAGPMLA